MNVSNPVITFTVMKGSRLFGERKLCWRIFGIVEIEVPSLFKLDG